MRAAWYEAQGKAAEVLRVGELDDPAPGPGEVVVRVHASGVNPSDVKTRAGLRGPMPFSRIVPHSDGAGVVERVGAGVPASRVGERVWLWNGQWRRPHGTAAERIALPAAQAVPLPDGVSFHEGACLGIPAMTAHRALFADGPLDGRSVLVTGGAGAVGLYAVQLAKWAGAFVLATVSSEPKAEEARRAGADVVVDYRREDVAARVLAAAEGGVDRIVEVDFGANLATTLRVVKPNGTVAVYASMGEPEPKLPVYAFLMRNVTIRPLLVYDMPEEAKRAACEDVGRWLATGRARHRIAARLPLARIAEAHERVERGDKIGQVVVDLV